MKLLVRCDICGKICGIGEWIEDCEVDYCKKCHNEKYIKHKNKEVSKIKMDDKYVLSCFYY
jgi:hypothetical protein